MLSLWNRAKGIVGQPIVQVRHAHKKVVSSKTHMQDSPGKRLGPKKYENHQVKTGQIIYRQRGTKWYPGFNAGIGKDHTIFALEPGYVKYYLDPFHPKRRFIGIAKSKDDVLPYDHFAPTIRRLGKTVLRGKWADLEAQNLPRKVELAKDAILGEREKRNEARLSKEAAFSSQLAEFGLQLSEQEATAAAKRLVAIDGHLRGGKSLEDARFYTTNNFKYDLKLALVRGEINNEQLQSSIDSYISLADKVDSAIMFDSQFQLTKNLSQEELDALKTSTIAELDALIPDLSKPVAKKTKEAALALIARPCWTLKDHLRLKRRYLKPVLSESPETLGTEKDKKTVAIMKMNLVTRNIETLYRTKNAFLP